MRHKKVKDLSSKDIEIIRQNRLEKNKLLSSEYQLGLYIGHYMTNFIPSLSIDIPRYKTVIKVSKEDTIKHKQLLENWFNVNESTDKQKIWNEYRQYTLYLEDKYLPKEVIISIDFLNITDITELKKGIINTLWNTDCCSYSLKPEDIEITHHENYYNTVIKLKYKAEIL